MDTGFLSRDTFVATLAQTVFNFTFPVLKTTHVKASVNGLEETDFTIVGSTLTFGGSVSLAAGDYVRIFRRSPATFATQIFQATAVDHLDDEDLDTLVKGCLYYSQEIDDRRFEWDAGIARTAAFTAEPDISQFYPLDTSGGGFTVALPPIAQVPVGTVMMFEKVSADANQYTIDPDGAETIGGNATLISSAIQFSPHRVYRAATEWLSVNIF